MSNYIEYTFVKTAHYNSLYLSRIVLHKFLLHLLHALNIDLIYSLKICVYGFITSIELIGYTTNLMLT